MSSDRETTRIVRSWLDDGVTRLPDRVLDAVLDELPATRQRRMWWPLGRLFRKNNAAVLAVAAATVVVALMLGTRALPSGGLGVGAPGDDATQAPSPTPSPMPIALYNAPDGELSGGRYLIDDPFPIRITLDVPEGWAKCVWGPVNFGLCGPQMQGFTVQIIDNVVADPCDPSDAPLDPPVGPSVDDLVDAVAGLAGFEVTRAEEITVDGFHGKELIVTAPASTCGLMTWSTPDRTNGVGPGEINLLRILDVEGVRVMLAAAYLPGLSEEKIAELNGVMDSVSIAP